jgi:valyl-tRNA synthetase
MDEIPNRYNPKETEDKWYKFWEENNLFAAKPDPARKPFCIVIPPPNVTGILHMGHALNNTLQDILIRYRRMKGDSSLWMPGTDHAGIATQNVVEKSIAKEGLKRSDLGREKFIEKVWQWRELYGSTIIRQLKKLGASCDWERLRFTMDQEYSRAVIEVFVRLYEKGLIYQGSYIINWCPRCQTALSDEEAVHQELNANLYYIKYPLKDSPEDYVVVATTRPETMLGDTAVAVNPKDKRYKKLVGRILVLPLVGREIKIIADSTVDTDFGTGAVKVTPAHDPNDYLLGKKHSLEFINVLQPDGRMNENAAGYRDMDRFSARKLILEHLKEKGLLERTEPHKLSAGHCYRCHTITEPYLSKQWFVKMKPLAKPAIEAVKKGKIRFYPERWTKVYLNWMENIRDWCVSRQIWWGHRIPVYYCRNCPDRVIVSRIRPQRCPGCGSSDIYQDEDVLDTWFSSWLWPFATFYWPAESEDLKYFYPTSVLVTASEIIFFWVARMIMAGLEFMRDIPFRDVYIHGTVRDIEGKKMSKSLGNIIDPLEIIDEYGADALRFSLISITAQGQDVFLSKERFEQGRNFANKIWNASRFIITNLDASGIRTDLCVFFKNEKLDIINRWILSRFYSVLKEVTLSLDAYRFNEAAGMLYGFFWHEFCDWYLEIIKPDIKNPHNQLVMYKVLEKTLRLLHPFMPFITEEIWHKLPGENKAIMAAAWPHMQEQMIDKKSENLACGIFEIIKTIRNLRSEIEIPTEQKVNVSIYPHDKAVEELLRHYAGIIENLSRLEKLGILQDNRRPESVISDIIRHADIYLHFSGLIDISKEQAKIKEGLLTETRRLEAKKKLISNPEFVKKARAEVVKNTEDEIAELENKINRLNRLSHELL